MNVKVLALAAALGWCPPVAAQVARDPPGTVPSAAVKPCTGMGIFGMAGCIGGPVASGFGGCSGFTGCTGGFGTLPCSPGCMGAPPCSFGCVGMPPCSFGCTGTFPGCHLGFMGCFGASCFGDFSGRPCPRCNPFGARSAFSPPGGCRGCFPSTFPLTFEGHFDHLPTPPASRQFYTGWSKFPGKSYYHRGLNVAHGPNHREISVVFYPDRPQFFFFFDPEKKVYLGRYRLGAAADACFSILLPKDRKGALADVDDRVYRQPGPMPAYTDLGVAWASMSVLRPPEDLPGDHLPPDEPLGK